MVKKHGFLVGGIPIKPKWKYLLVGIFLILLILNIVLPQYIDAIDYPGKGYVSIALVILTVLFSIGSYTTESIIIAIAIVGIISNCWDFVVQDFSSLRRQIMFWSIGVLVFELTFGKIGLVHFVKIFKNQMGVSGK